jgi:hypothetical protein
MGANNYWESMATETSLLGMNDNGFAACWGPRLLPPGELTRFRVVMSWMKPNRPPTLAITEVPESYDLSENLTFTATVSDPDGDRIGIYAVMDGDFSMIHPVETGLSSGTTTEIEVPVYSWGVSAGKYTFSFYAIDSQGSISREVNSFMVTAIAPTPTASWSPSPTQSMTPPKTQTASRTPTTTRSATRSKSPSPTTAATPTPFPYLLTVAVVPTPSATQYNFRIDGYWPTAPSSFFRFATTSANAGFQSRINFTGAAGHQFVNPWKQNTYVDTPCTVEARSVAIESAAIVMYRVTNPGTEPQSFHLSVSLDQNIYAPAIFGQAYYQIDIVHCQAFDDWTGFTMDHRTTRLNLFFRNHTFATDATTFWYGAFGFTSAWYWRMTPDAEYNADASTWSWQNRTVEPGKSYVCSFVVSYGFGSVPPVLDLSATQLPDAVYWIDELHLKGTISHPTSTNGSLLLVYDDDNWTMSVLNTRVFTNVEFDLPFTLAEAHVPQGNHTLKVYAVDITGEVSDPVSFQLRCIAPTPIATDSPTPTASISASPEPTPTASIRMSQTPSDSPTPSSSPYADIEMFVSSDVDSKTNFRIQGIRRSAPSQPIELSSRGFTTRYSVNGTNGFLARMQPVEVSGIEITTNIETSLTTAVIQFHISNTLTEPQNVSIGLDSAILVNGERHSYIYQQADGSGFRIIGGLSHFQVFCQNYPLVTDVDSYWFGPYTSLESSYYTQVNGSVFNDESGAIALSWRDRPIPARTRVTLSMLMTWGEGADRPTVELDKSRPLPQPKEVIRYDDNVSIGGAIDVSSGADAESIVIYLVVDGEVVAEVHPDSEGKFTISFTPSSLRLAGGSHEFQVYAVDTAGAIAPIATFKNEVSAPTEKQSQTAQASSTPTASATASASWGEIIDVPWMVSDVPQAADDMSSITVGKIVIGVGAPIGVILIAGFAFLIHRYRIAIRADMNRRLQSDSQTDPSTGMGI